MNEDTEIITNINNTDEKCTNMFKSILKTNKEVAQIKQEQDKKRDKLETKVESTGQ